jgi:hypothetical protein
MLTTRALLVAIAGLGGAACGGGGDDGGPIELSQPTAFWLPINSERLGASGRVPGTDVCVGLDWDFSNLGMARTRHCDDFVEHFPYAVVRLAVDGSCQPIWDYGPDAEVQAASGCIDPDWEGGTAHVVDVTAQVASPAFTGVVHVVTQ